MQKRIKNREDFINKSVAYHGADVFGYDNLVYVDGTTPVTVTCKVCGDFETTNKLHFKNAPGCPKCNRKKGYDKRVFPFGQEDFEKKGNETHNYKFDYSRAIYKNCYTSVTIGCPIHGYSEIEPRHHYKGTGCYRCGRDSFSEKVRKYKTLDQLLQDCEKAQGDRFDYSLIEFPDEGLDGGSKIPIICKVHGKFEQPIKSHVSGNGCNQCRYFGYTREAYIEYCEKFGKATTEVYLLKFYRETEWFYKIGITAQTIKERFRRKKTLGGYKYDIIFSIDLLPDVAWDIEEHIKKNYMGYKYTPLRWFPGVTECFNKDLPIQEIIDQLKNN